MAGVHACDAVLMHEQTTYVECGTGIAACPLLGLLAVSVDARDAILLFALPGSENGSGDSGSGGGEGGEGEGGDVNDGEQGLRRIDTVYSVQDAAHGVVTFRFQTYTQYSGHMAFLGPVARCLLAVTDAGHEAVHLLDVLTHTHVGYVARPGTITAPAGVAAWESWIAVSTAPVEADHVIRLYEGAEAEWTLLRVIGGGFGGPGPADGQLHDPRGLRFVEDGTVLAVADKENDRVSTFRTADGAFVTHVATRLPKPEDVECNQDGWLVPCLMSGTVEALSPSGKHLGSLGTASMQSTGTPGTWRGLASPVGIALVPGLGLLVRDSAHTEVLVMNVSCTVARDTN